jgi:squalene-hopene/tetraprenyl-beta-curcumene cyclase
VSPCSGVRLTACVLFCACLGVLPAAEPPTRAEVEALIAQVQAWSLGEQQPDGAFLPGTTFTLGVTALTAQALVQEPGLPADHPAVQRALAFVLSKRQPDGGIYDPDEGLGNYGTAIALRLFATVGGVDPAVVEDAKRWILGRQNRSEGSYGFGGMGYGDDKRPGWEDLSNTGYAIEGLRAAGVHPSDPAMEKALRFLERCQNLKAVNDAPFIVGAGDGGAVYSAQEASGSWEKQAAGGDPEKFHSSGTMTYTLISSYLALDLAADDPRVAAALAYVKAHYQFAANPGMPPGKEEQGLFHYYAMMGRTFALLGEDRIALPDGRTVDWRADLFAAIRERLRPVPLPGGGTGATWVNRATRWGEGEPHLASIYVLGALKAIHTRLPP